MRISVKALSFTFLCLLAACSVVSSAPRDASRFHSQDLSTASFPRTDSFAGRSLVADRDLDALTHRYIASESEVEALPVSSGSSGSAGPRNDQSYSTQFEETSESKTTGRRHASAAPISIVFDASYTNDMLEQAVCQSLAEDTLIVNIIPSQSAIRENKFLSLPSCLYNAPNVTSYALIQIIITDPGHTPAGKGTLAFFSPKLVQLGLQNCILRTAAAPSKPLELDWTAHFEAYPLLENFGIISSGLVGSLPSALPSLTSFFRLSNNLLTGSIPSGLFSGIDSSNSAVHFEAAHNLLAGGLPYFVIAPGNTLTEIFMDFTGNHLSGEIPAAWLSSLTVGGRSGDITVALGENALVGTLPSNLLTIAIPDNAMEYVLTLNVSHNRITGTIPPTLFSTRATKLYFFASSNMISGTIPDTLFAPPPTNGIFMNVIGIDFSHNLLEGPLPDVLFKKANFSWTSSVVFALDLSSNRIDNTIPDDFVSFFNPYDLSSIDLNLSNNSLSGSLPKSLLWLNHPAHIGLVKVSFNLSRNGFTGVIPSDLFNSPNVNATFPLFSSLNLDVSHNKLSDDIPADLLLTCRYSSLNDLSVDFSFNEISGNIPPTFLKLPSSILFATTASFSFASNRLSGTAPLNLLASIGDSNFGKGFVDLTLDFSSNLLSGSISNDLLQGSLRDTNKLRYLLGHNSISGFIPDGLFSSMHFESLSSLTLDLSSNQVSGTIPTALLAASPGIGSLSLYLDYNTLTGSIPSTLLQSSVFPALTLSLAFNSLTGAFPTDLLHGLPSTSTFLNLTLDNNNLGGSLAHDALVPTISSSGSPIMDLTLSLVNTGLIGSFPNHALTSLRVCTLNLGRNSLIGTPNLSNLTSSPNLVRLNLVIPRNRLVGTLAIPTASIPSLSLSLIATANDFTALSIPESAFGFVTDLDVSSMPSMTGTVPNSFLGSTSTVKTFNASGTALSGNLVNLHADSITSVDLSNSNIDLCTSVSSIWASEALQTCSLRSSSAVGCPQYFPSICFDSVAPSSPSSISCPNATRPSPAFVCVNGVWTLYGDANNGTLTIPSGATTTIIHGNLGASQVIIQSPGSIVVVSGCANNLTSITIELTQEDLKKLGSKALQTLLIYANDNSSCEPIVDISLNTDVKDKGCRRVKASLVTSQGTVSGLFTIDSSRCNRWWIILVSVIAAAVVIAVIIFVALVIFVPKVRVAVRPYSNRKPGTDQQLK